MTRTIWDAPTPPAEEWLKLGWQPMETCPDEPVMRPHVLWGPIAVERRDLGKGPVCLLTVLSAWFPEEAFEPYWMPIPKQPRREALRSPLHRNAI